MRYFIEGAVIVKSDSFECELSTRLKSMKNEKYANTSLHHANPPIYIQM
jgi:hypothetical protein